MERSIAYILRISPNLKGELEIEGERFDIYEEVDPIWETFFKSKRGSYIVNLRKQLIQRKAEGNTRRDFEIIIKEDIK